MSYGNYKRAGTVSKSKRASAAPRRGDLNEQLEQLKERLLSPLLDSVAHPGLAGEVRWAAQEAAALAWITPCPMLVLPALLDEKVRQATQRWERQQLLWRRQNPSLTRTVAEATAIVLPLVAPAIIAA